MTEQEELARYYDGLSDEYLLERWRSGRLTEAAKRVAEAEVRKRKLGVGVAAPAAAPPQPQPGPALDDESLSDWCTVYRSNNVVEAQILRARLESDGIPVAAIDYHQVQTDPLLAIAMGGTRIQVPAEYAEQAVRLLAHVQSGELAVAEEAPEQASDAPKPARDKLSLWNPDMAALLSWLFFTPVFGALVHAVNWRRLGQKGRMHASIAWAVASFAVMLGMAWRGADGQKPSALPLLVNAALLIVWYFAFGQQQARYVLDVLKQGYKKESWFLPLCAGAIVAGFLYGTRIL